MPTCSYLRGPAPQRQTECRVYGEAETRAGLTSLPPSPAQLEGCAPACQDYESWGEEVQILDIVLSENGCVTLGWSTALSDPFPPSSQGEADLDHLGLLLTSRFWLSKSGRGPRFWVSSMV